MRYLKFLAVLGVFMIAAPFAHAQRVAVGVGVGPVAVGVDNGPAYVDPGYVDPGYAGPAPVCTLDTTMITTRTPALLMATTAHSGSTAASSSAPVPGTAAAFTVVDIGAGAASSVAVPDSLGVAQASSVVDRASRVAAKLSQGVVQHSETVAER